MSYHEDLLSPYELGSIKHKSSAFHIERTRRAHMCKQICAIRRLSFSEHLIPMTFESGFRQTLCEGIRNHILCATWWHQSNYTGL